MTTAATAVKIMAMNVGMIHDPASERETTPVAINYILRVLERYSRLVGADVVDALIAMTIDGVNEQRRRIGPGGSPVGEPDHPINVRSIADSLGLPYETTRRRVKGLVEAGVCANRRGGVVIPESVAEREETRQILRQNHRDLIALVGALTMAPPARAA